MALKPAPSPTFADEGNLLARRSRVNVVGAGATLSDDAANDRLVLTVPGAAGGGGLPVFNVKADYGATGNGSTDDYAAIQNAINAAQNRHGGGIVFFPPGRYRITGQLVITQPVTLQGSGYDFSWNGNLVGSGSVICNNSGINTLSIYYVDTRPTNKMSNGVRIRDLGFDSMAAATTSYVTHTGSTNPGPIVPATAIDMQDNACNTMVENCWVARHAVGVNMCQNPGLYTADCELRHTFVYMCQTGVKVRGVGNKIHGCEIRANWTTEWYSATNQGTYGIEFWSSGTGQSDGHIVSDTEIISYEYGVYNNGGGSNVKLHNVWADTCINPFYFTGNNAKRAIFSSCFATACDNRSGDQATFVVGNAGFYISTSEVQMIGCMCYRGTYGYQIAGGGNIVLQGCTAVNPYDNCIGASVQSGVANVVISGNILTPLVGTGLHLVSGGATTVVTGNVLRNVGGTIGSAIFRGNSGASDVN